MRIDKTEVSIQQISRLEKQIDAEFKAEHDTVQQTIQAMQRRTTDVDNQLGEAKRKIEQLARQLADKQDRQIDSNMNRQLQNRIDESLLRSNEEFHR